MMNKFGLKTNRMHRMIAAALCVAMLMGMIFQVTLFSAPEGEKEEPEQAVTRVADESTINSWQEYFGSETDTSNAGKIWTDKTVVDGDITLQSTEGDNNSTTISRKETDNFLVGLSALSSTKSVTLEAAIPVDVMLVLDISGSMAEDEDDKKISMLVKAVNSTIQEILDMNEKNRVGVVLYSGALNYDEDSKVDTASCPLPLDRYTANDGTFFSVINYPGSSRIELGKNVKNSAGNPMYNEELSYVVQGNTYIQNGLMEAFQKLIPDSNGNNKGRIPVITLMSDGAPTAASVHYAEQGDSTVGYGRETDIRMAFLTQLTGAWVKKMLSESYSKTPLFYTVGLLAQLTGDDNKYARMVLNPSENTEVELDSWWNTFLEAAEGEIVHLEAFGKSIDVPKVDNKLQKAESGECTDRYYVDEFFNASSADDLIAKFEELVERIKIQSAELPTEEEEDNSNYSGYLTFEDTLGEYMNVADMTGVMYGGKLHTGSTFAEKMKKDGNATAEEKTEFLKSLIERLTITEEEAEKLLKNAQDTGQICYDASSGNASNYIAWYAKEDGTYLAPCAYEEVKPENAAFINKSYFYYGSSSGTISGEKLMYLGVRVENNLTTHVQTVRFFVPSSLIPLVKYNVLRNASNGEDSHTEKTIAYPVHLFYEVGLRDGINEYDLSEVDSGYRYLEKGDISKTGTFYSNAWEDKAEVPEAKTSVHFTVSEKNEYYYYTENTPIYIKSGENDYKLYTGEKPNADDGNEYYYQKIVYELDGGMQEFTRMDKASLNLVTAIDENAGWAIPQGTFRQETLGEKDKGTNGNATGTTGYVYKSMLEENSDIYEISGEDKISENGSVVVFLGNNGKTVVKQGKIAVSKTVDEFFEGDNEETEFNFQINLDPSEEEKIPASIIGEKTAVGGEKATEQIACAVEDGILKFNLKSKENIEFWLPAGKVVSVEEIVGNEKTYDTIMKVTQNGQTAEPVTTKKVESIGIRTQSKSSVDVVNNYNPPSEVIRLYKIDDSDHALEGATFELYRLKCVNPKEHNDEIHNKVIKNGERQECWEWIGKATSDRWSGYLNFVNDENKTVKFTKATYRLIETKAPEGYMRSVGQWNMIVVPGGDKRVIFKEVLGEYGEKPTAIKEAENRFSIINYKPINPPITGGRGIDRFLILGATVTISGLMITVHLVLQRKRGKL